MKKELATMDFAAGELVLLDKPAGWTSFALVTQLKKWTHAKVGHAGTLDPLASGLMICCTGKWTKKLGDLTGLQKSYDATIKLGAVTPTYDRESLPEQMQPVPAFTESDLEKVFTNFRGTIRQYPPVHSAVKLDGTPAYELARKGKEVAVKERTIQIYSLERLACREDELDIRVTCSSGTYIRSLAHDIGQALGCGAYLHTLQRTSIGPHLLTEAWTLDELQTHFGSLIRTRLILPKNRQAYEA